MSDQKPFCVVPFVKSFVLSDGRYRNCCVTTPNINSLPGETFDHWWNNNQEFKQFRDSLYQNSFPESCEPCRLGERATGNSLRTQINLENKNKNLNLAYPKDWSISFGNVCNLACWSCNENFSNTIAKHKKKINILPDNFEDPTAKFIANWPTLQSQILKSYEYHKTVVLTLYGGEPIYNPIVIQFLEHLIELGLGPRTKLQLTTNTTKTNKKLISMLSKKYWQHVFVAMSIDAVGKKAEWLRYGSNWDDILDNINWYKAHANYVEIHSTLSILNVVDLPSVYDLAKSKDIPLVIIKLTYPDFMNIINWDGPRPKIDPAEYELRGLGEYINLLGTNPTLGNKDKLCEYITTLSKVRKPLEEFDVELYNLLFGKNV